jgi:CubicO group peptidase (beta-lactamase class C family)
MVADEFFAEPEAQGIDLEKLAALDQRAGREVRDGLLPAAQIAVARHGKVVWQKSYGTATDDSLCSIFSATKGVISAATWLLLQDGKLALDERVVDIIEEFGSNDKGEITVLQLLTHTAGFPGAPFRPLDWNDKAKRLARFAQWRLSWEPGSRFEYHPTATMWVLAEIIERRSGQDFREFIRERIMQPLNLPEFIVGLPLADATTVGQRVLPCEHSGDPLTSEDYQRMGMPEPPVTEVTEEAILAFNRDDVRAVGVPGGGGICGAGELALFYQALLHGGLNGEVLWHPDTMQLVRQVHTGELKDPIFKKLANRGLGIIIAGGDDRSFRGFGKTNSPETFGHNGAGGQLAWVDPATGLSLGYVTSGHDRNPIRQGSRGVALSSIAAGLLV